MNSLPMLKRSSANASRKTPSATHSIFSHPLCGFLFPSVARPTTASASRDAGLRKLYTPGPFKAGRPLGCRSAARVDDEATAHLARGVDVTPTLRVEGRTHGACIAPPESTSP